MKMRPAPGSPTRSRLPAGFTKDALPLPLRFGGHSTILRWLRPDDATRLLAFFASHSEETVHQRYGGSGIRMTPEQATKLVSVDQARDAALGVFEPDANGRLIAVGRYCLAPGGAIAEAAFVVHEQRRRLGIATTLMAALVAIARERGLRHLVAEVSNDNGPMLHVLRNAGATFDGCGESSVSEATIELQERLKRRHALRAKRPRAESKRRRSRAQRRPVRSRRARVRAR